MSITTDLQCHQYFPLWMLPRLSTCITVPSVQAYGMILASKNHKYHATSTMLITTGLQYPTKSQVRRFGSLLETFPPILSPRNSLLITLGILRSTSSSFTLPPSDTISKPVSIHSTFHVTQLNPVAVSSCWEGDTVSVSATPLFISWGILFPFPPGIPCIPVCLPLCFCVRWCCGHDTPLLPHCSTPDYHQPRNMYTPVFHPLIARLWLQLVWVLLLCRVQCWVNRSIVCHMHFCLPPSLPFTLRACSARSRHPPISTLLWPTGKDSMRSLQVRLQVKLLFLLCLHSLKPQRLYITLLIRQLAGISASHTAARIKRNVIYLARV